MKTRASNAKTTEQFIIDANKIHNNTYDYSLVDYRHCKEKIIIICKEHGKFLQKPYVHLMGNGCQKCANETQCKTKQELIDYFNKIHKNKYDYSLLPEGYIKRDVRLKIICPVHGAIEQNMGDHFDGYGCAKCAGNIHLTRDIFIEKAMKKHGKKYIYDFIPDIVKDEKVTIVCKKHGPFIQKAGNHINVSAGCPKCHESKGEMKIRIYLENNNIDYEYQKRYKNCKYKLPLSFDFYLPHYNLCIEYDGVQHYKRDTLFEIETDDVNLNKRKLKDNIKNKYCIDNGIKLLRIPYWEYKNIENILYAIMSNDEIKKNLYNHLIVSK
jgi:hypothetical protein